MRKISEEERAGKTNQMKTKPLQAKPAPKHRALNVRQQRFCEFIVAGESQTDAYLMAGWKVTRKSARVNASELLAKPNIKAHIADLRKPQTKKAILTKDRKRELMHEIAESKSEKTQDRLRAIELDAKLNGEFAPDRVEVETGPNTLQAVRERAKEMASAMSIARQQLE